MNAAIMLIVVFRILPEDGALEKRFCLSPHAVNTTSYKETLRFPSGSAVKNLPANAGDSSLIPGWGRSLGVGNGNLLQYSRLENYMDREAWHTVVPGVIKSQT